MELSLAMPFSTGEWLAFITALLTIVIGLGLMIFPRSFGGFLGLVPRDGTNNGVSELRGPFGGMWVGLGLACILLAQPLVYLALGIAFAFAVIGRLISFVADSSFNRHCLAGAIFEALAAFFPIAYVLQLIP